ncbi:twin-arginine translocase TatA/TatE family subunit [Bremerella sp.]|uniref:Sec-independent protein translocase subunit TatA/TatB n=1 Tax=Bremerella sp. TaxID=2795602 RepID=UPI003918C392
MLHEIGTSSALLGFFGGMGMQEMAIIGVIAILLFGKNLPGVAKTFGKYYGDFKRGLSDIQSEFHNATREVEDSSNGGYSSKSSPAQFDDYDDFEEASAPKFEPPPQSSTPEKSELT